MQGPLGAVSALPENKTKMLTSTDIKGLRVLLESHFSKDTTVPGTVSTVPSAGHCAAVAIIAHALFGASIVSAIVQGQSHWFNRAEIDGKELDFDLTADQFGLPKILTGKRGTLYPKTRIRKIEDANTETIERTIVLAQKAGLRSVCETLTKGDICSR